VNVSNRQRDKLYTKRGKPVLSLEFDVWSEGKVSMWAHTRHDVDFQEMKRAFVECRDHLNAFIEDEAMCPFNHQFTDESAPPEQEVSE